MEHDSFLGFVDRVLARVGRYRATCETDTLAVWFDAELFMATLEDHSDFTWMMLAFSASQIVEILQTSGAPMSFDDVEAADQASVMPVPRPVSVMKTTALR